MPMNVIHRRLCRSDAWACQVNEQLLPWILGGVDLGADVLEIGPGYGVTTRLLMHRAPRLTVVEVDPDLAGALDAEIGDGVRVLYGDGADLPLPHSSFDAVVCFTMLHHMIVVDPATLPRRLRAAGLVDPDVAQGARSIRFRASRGPASC